MGNRSESIVLFGGPKDGAVIEVDAAPPMEYPVMDGFFPGMPSRVRLGIYAPRIDKYGKVQQNAAGHPIYEWRGEQA